LAWGLTAIRGMDPDGGPGQRSGESPMLAGARSGILRGWSTGPRCVPPTPTATGSPPRSVMPMPMAGWRKTSCSIGSMRPTRRGPTLTSIAWSPTSPARQARPPPDQRKTPEYGGPPHRLFGTPAGRRTVWPSRRWFSGWAGWIGSILAVVFGHVALKQIERTGQGGRGMAVAGLVLGYLGLSILALIMVIIAIGSAIAGTGTIS
jgi:hypothetical protein